MPPQQTQGVNIRGNGKEYPAVTTTSDGQYERLDVMSKIVGATGNTLGVNTDGSIDIEIKDQSGTPINPASEESILLLRRIVKLLESNSVVDIASRQKIALDASTTGIFAYPGLGGGSLANTPTAGAPNGAQTAYPITVWETPVDQRWRVMEESRVSYQIGIRNNLAFS